VAKKFAVFDIDGTVIRWQLAHAVYHEMGKRGHLPKQAHEKIMTARKRWKNRTHEESFREYEQAMIEVIESSLATLNVSALREASAAAFETYKDQTYLYTRELIRSLKEQGYILFAISGSPDIIVEQFVKQYGFDDFIATHFVEENGKFTGHLVLPVRDKASVLKQLATKHNVNFTGSIGIGDSEGDIVMLELVERPIAFNPSKKLFQHAQASGWKVVIERKNMIYELEQNDGRYILA
jgi:HAD superfamily hydrolase (TIGR01490 family)